MKQELENRRKNVIWIFGDQHRASSVGWVGREAVRTPHLDRLAGEGVAFTRALATCPLCCPARGTLLTGRYPHHTVPAHEYRLDPEQPTLADVLKEHGYHTAYVGKWHLDGFKESTGRAAHHVVPADRRGGFDYWVGYENNNSPWDSWVHGTGIPEPKRLDGYETGALTTHFLEHLSGHVEAHPEQPFFGVLSVQPPHDPYLAPAESMGRRSPAEIELPPNVPPVPWIEDRARRQLAGYYAMIEDLDHQMGRIVAKLGKLGIEKDTQILFFSDHGDMHGSHGLFAKTHPYAESLHVPLIIGGGQPFYGQAGGQVHDDPIGLVDLAPTTLGLCGIEVPDWMEGFDYAPRRWRKPLPENAPACGLAQFPVPTGHGNSIDRPWRAIVSADGWKYACLEGQPWLLFNLNEDPYELANQALNPSFHQQRQELQGLLAAELERIDDPFPLPA